MTGYSTWHVYIVCCQDGTLYTGITTDVIRRVAEHNSEKEGARYTRSRRPVYLVYEESVDSRSAAGKREWQIKKMRLAKKMELVRSYEPVGNFCCQSP